MQTAHMTTEQHPETWRGRLRAAWAVLDALHNRSSERLLSHYSRGREILVLTVLCKGAVQEKKRVHGQQGVWCRVVEGLSL